MRTLTRDEQETCINYDAANKTAIVYSSDPVTLRRMERLAADRPDEVALSHEDELGKTYEVPKSWVKVRPPRRVSEEQREAARERFAKIREDRSGQCS